MEDKKEIPLIKEYRLVKIKKCLECFNKNKYNRNKQIECVLKLYPIKNKNLHHREKSIFRGMVIPSLRYLGLIRGYGDSISVSANGKLIINSKFDIELNQRAIRSVIYEMDKKIFCLLPMIEKYQSSSPQELFNNMYSQINAYSEKSKKERILKWLTILKQTKIISSPRRVIHEYDKIFVNKNRLNQIQMELNGTLNKQDQFEHLLLDSYFELNKRSGGIVEIEDLREKVSMGMLKFDTILTENLFDEMMRKMPLDSDRYIISLGKPMGAQEKLFEHHGNHYKTLFIKRLKAEK